MGIKAFASVEIDEINVARCKKELAL